jgi:hypothetical protein
MRRATERNLPEEREVLEEEPQLQHEPRSLEQIMQPQHRAA